MSIIIAFLLYIGVISAPEQATEALKESYRVQCEQHVSIVGEDITGW